MLQIYNDDAASDLQKRCRKVVVQEKDQAFNGKDFISVVNVLTDFKKACHSSRNHEGAAAWLFRKFMNCPDLAVIKVRLTLS